MGVLVEGVWEDQWYDTQSTAGRFVRCEIALPQLDHAPTAPLGLQGKAALGPSPAAIISMFRSLVRGRIAL